MYQAPAWAGVWQASAPDWQALKWHGCLKGRLVKGDGLVWCGLSGGGCCQHP
jgi:hypothetical protein